MSSITETITETIDRPKRDFAPLESNPTAINKYMNGLGCPTDQFAWSELVGLICFFGPCPLLLLFTY